MGDKSQLLGNRGRQNGTEGRQIRNSGDRGRQNGTEGRQIRNSGDRGRQNGTEGCQIRNPGDRERATNRDRGVTDGHQIFINGDKMFYH